MDMEDYYTQLREVALKGFTRLNKTRKVESNNWELPVGSLEVNVTRGEVLEKAATCRIRLKTKNPATGEDTRFDVFQIKTYPTFPKIPILLFNMENRVAKKDTFGGFLDVAPVATTQKDLNFLNAAIVKVTEQHGADYEGLRRKIIDVYKMDRWDHAVNAAIGMRLELTKEQCDLVKEAGLKWLESYFTIVAQRAGEPYTKEEEILMYSVRARIMEFYILKDMSFQVIQKLGAPLDAMSLVHFAPTIKY